MVGSKTLGTHPQKESSEPRWMLLARLLQLFLLDVRSTQFDNGLLSVTCSFTWKRLLRVHVTPHPGLSVADSSWLPLWGYSSQLLLIVVSVWLDIWLPICFLIYLLPAQYSFIFACCLLTHSFKTENIAIVDVDHSLCTIPL